MGMISLVECSLVESSSNEKCWQCVLQIIHSSSEAVSAEHLECNFSVVYVSQTKLQSPHLDLRCQKKCQGQNRSKSNHWR